MKSGSICHSFSSQPFFHTCHGRFRLLAVLVNGRFSFAAAAPEGIVLPLHAAMICRSAGRPGMPPTGDAGRGTRPLRRIIVGRHMCPLWVDPMPPDVTNSAMPRRRGGVTPPYAGTRSRGRGTGARPLRVRNDAVPRRGRVSRPARADDRCVRGVQGPPPTEGAGRGTRPLRVRDGGPVPHDGVNLR